MIEVTQQQQQQQCVYGASQVALVVKNLPANAGDVRDTGLIPGLGRPSGGGTAGKVIMAFLLVYTKSCLRGLAVQAGYV